MLYNIYKHCSEEQFERIKEQLNLLNDHIVEAYPDELIPSNTAKEVDALVLNYVIFDSFAHGSNLAIMFEDKIGTVTFDVGVVKTLDIGSVRYGLKSIVAEGVSLKDIRVNFRKFINKGIELYNSWDDDQLKSGTAIEIRH
jgi:hypothetical protein